MTYTPVELKHVRVPRRLFGYDQEAVEALLEEVAASFETVWRDRADLAEKVEALEAQLEASTRQERLLTDTLVSAEQTADDVRERSKREADAILADARAEARAIVAGAHAEHERLVVEARRVRALLRAALEVVEGDPAIAPIVDAPGADAAAEPPAPGPAAARLEPVPLPAAPEPAIDPEDDAGVEPQREPEAGAADEGEQADDRGWPVFRRAAGGSAGFDWGD